MSKTTSTRRIDDAGEKILGARKDWYARALSSEDMLSMTNEEVIENVRKDHIWPKPDYEKLVADGMPINVAAYIKIVRDRMAQKPKPSRYVDEITLRKYFLEMTELLRDTFLQCKTVGDVTAVLHNVSEAIGGYNTSRDNQVKFFSVATSRYSPFQITRSDDKKVKDMISQGFPGKIPAWMKGISIVPRMGTFAIVKGGYYVERGFETEDAAKIWLQEQYEAKVAKVPNEKPKPARKKIPKRPHLDRVLREGLPFSLDNRDVTSEDFLETFGFRGVQFGNWVADDERQRVLNMGYEALMDLADVLGWAPRELSLNGTLAIAFGARGQGGNTAAHYEAGQRVVNMTKLSGAGSLAHEFGHALDHWLGTGSSATIPGGIPSASGWRNKLSDLERKRVLNHRGDEVVKVMSSVMHNIYESPITKQYRLKNLNNWIEKTEKTFEDIAQKLKEIMDKGSQTAGERRYIKEARKYYANTKPLLSQTKERREQTMLAGEDDCFGFRASNFVNEASKIAPSGDYWTRPNELFARAFEAWVHDEILARGGVSQYLVNGVNSDDFTGEEFQGNPYPTGKERDRINASMKAMVKTLRKELDLQLTAPSYNM